MWKTYGAHALTYLIGGLTLAQAYAGVVPGKGTVIAVAAGILLGAIHNIQTAVSGPSPTLPTPGVGTIKTLAPLALLLGMLIAASSLVGMSGCAALSKLGTPAGQTYLADAVDGAVLGAEIAGVSAGEINRIS